MRPSRVAQHDQVALRFEQAARALLGFLQFPIAVGQRLVVQHDLAHLLAAKRSRMLSVASAEAGDREQEARADGKGVGIVAGISATGCRR